MKSALLSIVIAGFSLVVLAPAAAASPASAKPIKATYTCAGGQKLYVVFQGNQATVTTAKSGKAIVMPQGMAADGFLYTDGSHSLRGRGDNATWTTGGSKPLDCTAKG
jgi:membrane-bound inhibitor of C-type lysozyme